MDVEKVLSQLDRGCFGCLEITCTDANQVCSLDRDAARCIRELLAELEKEREARKRLENAKCIMHNA